MMHGDCWVDEIAPQRSEPRQDSILVCAGESAVSDHVGAKDGREFASFDHAPPSATWRLPPASRTTQVDIARFRVTKATPGIDLGDNRRGMTGGRPVSTYCGHSRPRSWTPQLVKGFGRRPLARTRRDVRRGRRSKAPQGGNRVLEGRWRRVHALWGFRDRRVRAAKVRSEDRLRVGRIWAAAGGSLCGFRIRDGMFLARLWES